MRRYSVLGPNQILAVQGLIGKLNPKKRWSISIELDTPEHTAAQSRLWHACIDAVADATGNNRKTMKHWAYSEFGPRDSVIINDEVIEVIKDRSFWTIEEASTFTEKLSAWAASECGVML